MEKNLGHATAYGYAKSKGYTGTEEEFGVLMASYASVAQDASQSASSAAESAQLASSEAQKASQSATGAHNDAETASNIKTDVESARDTTVSAKNAAVEAKDISVEAKNSAISAKDTAENKAQIAEAWAVGQKDGTDVPSTDETYHNNAKYYSEQANIAKIDAESAQQLAQASATSASESASDAAASAQTASQASQTATDKASEASQSASTAATKASEASQSATSASQSAATATSKASEATTAATTATTKASEAAASATTASTAKINAETARNAAAQSSSEAAASAIEAAQSAQSVDAERLNRIAFGSYVVEESTGSIASFANGANDIPMKDVLVHIDPVQDLHGYNNPWPAGGGKNMLNPNDPDYGNYTIGPDGATSSENTRIATGFIPCNEGVQLTFSTNKKTDGIGTDVQFAFAGIAAYDNDKNFITRATINNQRTVTLTTPTGTKYVRAFEQITISGSSATITPTAFATYEQQLELGSTATAYSPYSNICPITGWTAAKVTRTGKNFFNPDDYYNLNDIYDYIDSSYRCCYIQLQPNTTYTISTHAETDDTTLILINHVAHVNEAGYLDLRRASGSKTWTTDDSGRLYIGGLNGTNELYNARIDACNVQIEFGSTATDYEPYSGQTYDIAFSSEAGTVYGGTLDVTKGELVVDRAMVTLDGTRALAPNGKTSTSSRFGLNVAGKAVGERNILSNMFYAPPVFTDSVGLVYGRAASNYVEFFLSPDIEQTTAAGKAWFAENPTQLVYKLATPITYHLTPQEITSLLGENNVWADTGDSEVTYCVDPTLLLDNESSEIQNIKSMIAGVESSAVATKNYSIGDLVIVEDTLYEVTAAIASGETISASKVRVTTVDDVIRNRIVVVDNVIENKIADSIDATLTQSGQAADAKVTGDEISLEKTGSFSLQSSDFESGTYNNHFNPVASTYRIRTAKKIPVYSGEKITIIPGEKCGRVAYGFFDESDVYLDAVAVTSETVITVSNQTYIIFICMYPNMGTTINPNDFDAVIEFTSFTQSEIESIQNNVESKQTDYGCNLIYKLTQFNRLQGVDVTVDSKKSLYAQDGIITLKSTDWVTDYRNAIMANNPLTFEAGAVYIMHATAKVITAPSKPLFSVRYGTTGFPPAHETPAINVTEPGIYELETTFVADGNEKTAGLFITGSEKTLYPEVEFSNVYIKRVISTGARDDLCRIAIRQLIGVIEQKINGAHTLADNVKSEILFNTAAKFTPQGACTDGEYIYYAGYEPAVFGKYNIATGENTIVEADSQIIGHANDMTYNPNTGYLYIATMQKHAIAIYDTDFQYINTITLNTEYQPYQIAYIRNLNQYVVSLSSKFVFYDANFELLYDIEPSSVPNYIAQGMETDGEYLYRVYYSQSVIAVYTMYGELIKTIGATNITGEPETLCYDWNGNWYAPAISSGFTLFRIAVYAINDGIEAIKSLLI